jgi:hypothetical protein
MRTYKNFPAAVTARRRQLLNNNKEPFLELKKPVGRKGLVANLHSVNSLLAHASWIEAESPQDLHKQIRGLAAESPVFFVRLRTKKMRPNSELQIGFEQALKSKNFFDFFDLAVKILIRKVFRASHKPIPLRAR